MVIVSFVELICQWRIFWHAYCILHATVKAKFGTHQKNRAEAGPLARNLSLPFKLENDKSVPLRIWIPGLITMILVTCLVMRLGFQMPILQTILALVLSALFAFLAIQATGATDITPLTAASKASQIVLASTTKTHGWTVQKAQSMNLLGGALAAIGAGRKASPLFLPLSIREKSNVETLLKG